MTAEQVSLLTFRVLLLYASELFHAALIPRYVRVNTTLWSVNEAIRHFESKGFALSTSDSFEVSTYDLSLLFLHSLCLRC